MILIEEICKLIIVAVDHSLYFLYDTLLAFYNILCEGGNGLREFFSLCLRNRLLLIISLMR